MIEITLFGHFLMRFKGAVIEGINGRRAQSILSYLILSSAVPVSRSSLAGVLWPDVSETQARTNLRRELHSIRRAHAILDKCLTTTNTTMLWTMPSEYMLDTESFDSHARKFSATLDVETKSREGEAAIRCYTNHLLINIVDPWVDEHREKMRQQWGFLCDELIALYEHNGDYPNIVRLCQEQIHLDGFREPSYASLMGAYIQTDNTALALNTFHRCETVLREELGISPGERILDLYQQLVGGTPTLDKSDRKASSVSLAGDLIGRDDLLAKLEDVVIGIHADLPHLILLTGEAGIGKSRIAEKFLANLSGQGYLTAQSECHPAQGDTPFSPIRAWLANEKLQESFAYLSVSLQAEIINAFPDLDLAQLSTVNNNEEYKNGEFTSLRQRLFYALSYLLLEAIESNPRPTSSGLLLYIDDIQWVDSDFCIWLKYFFATSVAHRVIIVATARSEELNNDHAITKLCHSIERTGQLTSLSVPELDRSSSLTLLNDTLKSFPHIEWQAETTQRIYSHVRGNPLFLIESARHLASSDRPINTVDDSEQLSAPKVHEIIQRRVNLLGEDARELVYTASVLDKQFSLEMIQKLTGFSSTQLLHALDELWRNNIIREAGVGEYNFAHDCLREACLMTLSPPVVSLIHQKIALILEQYISDNRILLHGEIAIHYEKSGNLKKALDWYLKASLNSRKITAYSDAIAYASQGIKLLDGAGSLTDSDLLHIKLLMCITTAHAMSDSLASPKVVELCKEMSKLLPLIDDPVVRFDVVNRFRITATFTRKTYTALRLSKQKIELANETKQAELRLEAHRAKSFVEFQLGRIKDAINTSDMGLRIVREAENTGELNHYRPTWSTVMLSYTHALLLYLNGRVNDSVQLLEVCPQHDYIKSDRQLKCFALLWVAKVHYLRNKVDDTNALGEQLIAIGRDEHMPRLSGWGGFYCAWSAWQSGNPDAGIKQLCAVLKEYISTDEKILLPWWYGHLAEMYCATGDLPLAQEALFNAGRFAREYRVATWNAEIFRVGAKISILTGQESASVERLYERSIRIAAKQNSYLYLIKTLTEHLEYQLEYGFNTNLTECRLRNTLESVQSSSEFKARRRAEQLLTCLT